MANMTRQNFYKDKKVRQKRQLDEELVLKAVRSIRQNHPMLGGRKLLYKISPLLAKHGISIGRDRLFDVLRNNHLLNKQRKRFKRTTYSNHGFMYYPNRLKDKVLTASNQAWVSDITYIRIEGGFVYLALITDAYSRKIVGYDVGDTLEAIGAIKALRKALRQLPKDQTVIHHSDRGIQYCCNEYKKVLRSRGAIISMTEENHCYENSQAERVNGILKNEYELGETFANKQQVEKVVKQVVDLYNNDRPHLALNYRYPAEVHAPAA